MFVQRERAGNHHGDTFPFHELDDLAKKALLLGRELRRV